MAANIATDMKAIFVSSLLLLSTAACAQTPVVVAADATTSTLGIGGSAQVGYAFAKGDVVTIEASASKKLERMLAFRFPEAVLGRVKLTKNPKLTFTMPEEGIAVFRFISDRDGTNKITYTVTRMPASKEVQDYNTKVDWKMPVDHAGTMIPERAAVSGD